MTTNRSAAPIEQNREEIDDSDSRQFLIKITAQIVAERGLAAATLRQIAKKADVSLGMVNHHFPAKRDLIMAVQSYAAGEQRKAIEAEGGSELSRSRLRAAFRGTWLPVSFWMDYIAEATHDEGLRKSYADRFAERRSRFRHAIEAGIAEGTFRSDIDPLVAADMLIALLYGTRIMSGLCPEIVDTARFEQIIDFAFSWLESTSKT